MKKGCFIVCEGLDCSGKTTSIKHALEYFKEVPIVYSKGLKTNIIAGRFSRLFPSTLSLLTELLYLDKSFVKPNLNQGKNIIQDRWYYSVFSYNSENPVDNFLEKAIASNLSKPDLLVYFSASPYERIRRLEMKKKDHEALLKNPKLIDQRENRGISYYNNFQGKKAILDTTNTTEEESGYKLYKIINSFLKNGN